MYSISNAKKTISNLIIIETDYAVYVKKLSNNKKNCLTIIRREDWLSFDN